MSRGPRPHRALAEAIPIAKSRSSRLPRISKRRSPSSGSLSGMRRSQPNSGYGRSTGRGGSSWSRQTRWSRSTAGANGLSRDKQLRTWSGLLSVRGEYSLPENPCISPSAP